MANLDAIVTERTDVSTLTLSTDGPLRRLILSVGRACRHWISSVIARFSLVGDPAIFENQIFPWSSLLERSAIDIRAEADVLMGKRRCIPALVDISPDHAGISNSKWKSFFLWGYGYQIHENCARCPHTTWLLSQIEGLETAFFSIMEPGARLTPHRGVSKAIITCHLGLRVPREGDLCWMLVDGHKMHWESGRAFIFDDTYEHEVTNYTTEDRVVLLLHIRRPVRFPGSIIAGAFLTAVRLSPFVQDALRNLTAWNRAHFSNMNRR